MATQLLLRLDDTLREKNSVIREPDAANVRERKSPTHHDGGLSVLDAIDSDVVIYRRVIPRSEDHQLQGLGRPATRYRLPDEDEPGRIFRHEVAMRLVDLAVDGRI